ncbi:unnamed protein product [Effrenium voratum]|uniref:PNPLA domain-containing protein n=2 Tax=Effrenium voratum TaxID=2562239 RepID=A0AA36N999_9DINO|nr:unnamed protein product [Effrenium voratum]CAJ1417434.1 unnamed protein product [Effrenium voratum]
MLAINKKTRGIAMARLAWCLALQAWAQDECAEEGCAASWLQRRALKAEAELNTSTAWGWSSEPGLGAEDLQVPLNQCFQDTGGSCTLFGCDKSRGEVVCENRRCKCKPGYCNQYGTCTKASAKQECIRVTDRTCRFYDCPATFGKNSCENRHCVCAVGHCVVDGTCHPEVGGLRAKVAKVSAQQPRFPGGSVRSALCFSGGGARALSFSLGVLRGLELLGLMRHVDAISSVSGGSWAASVYMFSTLPVSYLLGGASDFASLDLARLDATPAPLGAVAAVGTTSIAVKLVSEGVDGQELWTNTVSKAILEPFGLHDTDSYMAADQHAVEEIRRRNPQLRSARFLTPAPNRPKTFVMSGALLAPTGYTATKENVVSLQMSPDFIGSPFYPNDGPVPYVSQKQRYNEPRKGVVGGGFVESFAFGGGAPEDFRGSEAELFLAAPREPFSLSKAVGVSSAGVSAAVTQIPLHGSVNVANLSPRSDYWAIPSERFGKASASTYNLGDGGNVDNSGVLAMLQRRAKRVVWVINSGVTLPEPDMCVFSEVPDDVVKGMENQLRAAFGYWAEDDIGEFLTQNQVFAREELQPLLCQLQTLQRQGRPTLAQRDLRVLPNRWWGIPGGDRVQVVFVYIDKCSGFERQLPQETFDAIQSGSDGFKRFPHFRPVSENHGKGTALTHKQINLLAAMGEYFVRENEQLFRSFLR